jgi:glycine/D-amino acid oxidase-like deaminating enzyme
MIDLRSGLPYHLIRSGLPVQYPQLDHDARCTVLVIGGGITGALCAHALAQADIDVMVIEAGSIGTQSTSASTALLQYELDTPLHRLIAQVGEHAAVRSYHMCAEAVDELLEMARPCETCAGHARESLQYASKRSHLKELEQEHAARKQHGFETELIGSGALKERTGLKKPGALLSFKAGEVDPYLLTHHLLQESQRRGGRVMDRTRMSRMDRAQGHFLVRTDKDLQIRAEHVVMATGYQGAHELNEPGIELFSTYALASQRLPMAEPWYRNCLIWETATPYLYLRTTPDGRALIGGLDEQFRAPDRRDRLLDRKARKLTKAFNKLFPELPFVPEFQWCGTFGGTRDGLPYIGPHPGNGVWYVLGMGGNGITFSQAGARMVRDHVLKKPVPDLALFRFGRT